MNQEELMKLVTEEVIRSMMNASPTESSKAQAISGTQNRKIESGGKKVTKEQYPMSEKMADQVFSPTGKRLSDMKIEQIYDGSLTAEDMRVSPETLEMQAQIAESAGYGAFAVNLRRAGELINVPDERVLEIYNALRPYRSTKKELYDIAAELEQKYGAVTNASLIREAADVYEKRDRLKQEV